MPALLGNLRRAVQIDRRAGGAGQYSAVSEVYQRQPDLDFSGHILTGEEPHLRVLTVPQCGWSDLGAPHPHRRMRSPFHRTQAI